MKYLDPRHGMEIRHTFRNENMMLILAYYLKLICTNARIKNKVIDPSWTEIVENILDKATYHIRHELRVDTYYPERGAHLSIENMTAYYYLNKFVGRDISDLPVMRLNKRNWYHPNGWMILLSMKAVWWELLFCLPIYCMAMFSKLTNKGETTDKLLWWFRDCNLYSNEEMTEAFHTYMTFNYVYDNEDHPIIQEAYELFFEAIIE